VPKLYQTILTNMANDSIDGTGKNRTNTMSNVKLRYIDQYLSTGKKMLDTIAITASGISTERMRKYQERHDYFTELNEQYRFLVLPKLWCQTIPILPFFCN